MERVYESSLGEWPEVQKADDIGKALKSNLMKGLEGLSTLLLTQHL